MEKDFILLFYSILTWLPRVYSEVYPSLQWNPLNPLFKESLSLSVFPTSKMNLVCPNDATVLKRMRDNTPKEELYENVWFVDKASYDKCEVNKNVKSNRQLWKCSDPSRLQYLPVVFQQYSPTGGLEFKPGSDYYFISTSDGTVGSLNNTSGGHCKTHNMRIKIHVCSKVSDSQCTSSTSRPPLETAATRPAESTSSPVVVTEQTGCAHAHRNKINITNNSTRNKTLPHTIPASPAGREDDDSHRVVSDELKYQLAIGCLLAVIFVLLLITVVLIRKKCRFIKDEKVRTSTNNGNWRNSTSSTRQILRFSGVSQADGCNNLNNLCEQTDEQNAC